MIPYSGLSAKQFCVLLQEYFQAITVLFLFVCTVKSMFSTWSHAQPLNTEMAECTERERGGGGGDETRRAKMSVVWINGEDWREGAAVVREQNI